jgi:uncharacterized integral membrane protein
MLLYRAGEEMESRFLLHFVALLILILILLYFTDGNVKESEVDLCWWLLQACLKPYSACR